MSFKLTSRTTPNLSARSGAPRYFIVHRMQGYFDASVSLLCRASTKASADECVSRDGNRVCVLNWERNRRKSWEVGNANDLCIGWEIEGFEGDEASIPANLYDTLAKRMIARQKTVKATYGVTIPLRVTHTKGVAGITSHYQVGLWYGGTDHVDGRHFNYAKLQDAINRNQHPVKRAIVRTQYALEVIQDGKIAEHLTYGGGRVGRFLSGSGFTKILAKGEARLIRHKIQRKRKR